MGFYDIIIVGGGISGLYTLFKLSQKYPCLHFLLLEKDERFGGRIYTYIDKNMVLENGAGRFNDLHILWIQLIHDLHLKHKIRKTSTDVEYKPDKNGEYKDDGKEEMSIADRILQFVLGDKKSSLLKKFILQIIMASIFESKETLLRVSFIQYAKRVLDKEKVQYIENSFGYYKELHDMSAYNCIELMKQISPTNHNYALNGGISSVVNKLEEIIKTKKNCTILNKKDVLDIQWIKDKTMFEIKVSSDKEMYYCHKLICALPREALIKFPIFSSIQTKWLDKITSGSLCRIYSRFPKGPDGKYWFQDLSKITTNNALRMIIPYHVDSGVVMISYSDSHYADYWYRLYKSKGIHTMNRKIRELVKDSLDIDIPKPIETKFFYWDCGVGYWKIGVDSSDISNKILKPFEQMNLFICGENYSGTFQQWIEGSLETSEKVMDFF